MDEPVMTTFHPIKQFKLTIIDAIDQTPRHCQIFESQL